MRKNIQASNYSFIEKKDAYNNADNVVTSFLTTQRVIQSEIWDEHALSQRKEFLIDRIMKQLNIF